MLDKYTSSNLDYGLRAEDLPALLYVLQSLEPVSVLLQAVGADAIDHKESKLIRYARLEQKKAELDAEMARLRHELNIRGK